ncbi:hypothetical protein PIB30_107916 [Stylosanthes scabra]|uniref:Uncharacterized protein n=1 Tax=Stylosanthes scabra TaxID=79078 RepID=A0ABU6S054_9FABA|nr:hypothetical protein [Stylosanthes scabra]
MWGDTAPCRTSRTSTSSGTDVDLARFMEYGGGSGSQPGDGGPPSHRYGTPSDMYELFLCGEQTMDQIAHGYVTSRPTNDVVYRPSPPLQPHPDYSQPCQGFCNIPTFSTS